MWLVGSLSGFVQFLWLRFASSILRLGLVQLSSLDYAFLGSNPVLTHPFKCPKVSNHFSDEFLAGLL